MMNRSAAAVKAWGRTIPYLAVASVAVICGLISGTVLRSDPWLGWWISLSFLGVALFWHRYPLVRYTALTCLCFSVGLQISWQAAGRFSLSAVEPLYGEKVEWRGEIIAEPDVRDIYTRYTVEVESIKRTSAWEPAHLKLLVTVNRYPEFHYGEVIEAGSEIEVPFETDTFSYREYLSRQGIYAQAMTNDIESTGIRRGSPLVSTLIGLKSFIGDAINRLLPEPESSLLSGLLLGMRKGFSESFKSALSTTGTTHIIAISGYNISIIVLMLEMLLRRWLSRRWQFIWISIGLIFFIILVGASASVLRAGFMGWLALLSRQVGRPTRITTTLLLAACAMLMLSPQSFSDLGFQLSFLSTAGIVSLQPIFEQAGIMRALKAGRQFRLDRYPVFKMFHALWGSVWGYAIDTLSVTMAAQVLVLPVLLSTFGVWSLISPVVNVAVLFSIPWAMGLGFGMILLGLILPVFSLPVAFMTWCLLHFIIVVISLFARVPWASVSLPLLPMWGVLLWYGAVAVWVGRQGGKGRRLTVPKQKELLYA